MKIYFAGGAPKPIKIPRGLLFSFFGIKNPVHRYGTKADFEYYVKQIKNENLSGRVQSS